MHNKHEYSSVFVGGVKLSGAILETLIEKDSGLRAVFCPTKEASSSNHDYLDLRPLAKGLDFHYYDDVNSSETLARIKSYKPDVAYVIGTSQILKKELLSIPKIGVLGGHIAMLPYNRGCNPIIWAIANGLTHSGLTMIWLDQGVDTGDIAAQREFDIKLDETATEIYAKVVALYQDMLGNELIPLFHRNSFPRRSQPKGPTNYWRRRKPSDGFIDWRMSATRIQNLVRALCPPYPGAEFKYKGVFHKVWRAEICAAQENRVPGEVLDINEESFMVKAGEGAIWIREHKFDLSNIRVGSFLG